MTLWQRATDSLLGAAMSTFGELVLIRPGKEGHQEIRAVFRAAHAQVDLERGAVATANPELDVRLRDVAGAPLKATDVVVVRGVRYTIAEPPQPDGEGGAKLKLARETRP